MCMNCAFCVAQENSNMSALRVGLGWEKMTGAILLPFRKRTLQKDLGLASTQVPRLVHQKMLKMIQSTTEPENGQK